MFQVLLPSHESWVLPSILMLVQALEAQGVRLVVSSLKTRYLRALAKALGSMRIGRLPFTRGNEAAFFHINHLWFNGLYPIACSTPV
jgi:hypothetical protein